MKGGERRGVALLGRPRFLDRLSDRQKQELAAAWDAILDPTGRVEETADVLGGAE